MCIEDDVGGRIKQTAVMLVALKKSRFGLRPGLAHFRGLHCGELTTQILQLLYQLLLRLVVILHA